MSFNRGLEPDHVVGRHIIRRNQLRNIHMPVENMVRQRRRLLPASEKYDVLRPVSYLAKDPFDAIKISQDEQRLSNRLIINRSQPELHSQLLHRVPVHPPATAQRSEALRNLV